MSDLPDTEATPKSAATLFGEYRPSQTVFDESLSNTGTLRPHWEELAQSIERLGREELAVRWDNGRRIIREHGVTYNVYGDPQGMDRPWELDLVPLLIPPGEWRLIEAGLMQRARLFHAILTDLYGPQRLLRDGLIPPALVFGNPGFLRACHGIRPPGNIYLHLHAVDLARSPNGQWWVLADRTQAPSGTGYALENRIVLSRILPDEFRECHVQRLASFFRTERDTLRSLAPDPGRTPNVVLLTPGPHNETYFEQAYLARYLGFTLAEGGDLTVRDRRVFIKTLEGLQRVDVILRRVDDTFCDPLELRSDSFLGVPGLVEAARAGHVTIANALGSGVVEGPGFLPFLPGLCRHLFGEELLLPNVATWWCGQAREQQYVLDHLPEIVIKPAFSSLSRVPSFGRKLPARDRARLLATICARPFEFVGQEQVALSTSPVWIHHRLEPRRVVLRTYIAARGDSFAVMPGGLTRVSGTEDEPIVSMQAGGGSKDTWILSDGPVEAVSLLTAAGVPISATRATTELPSRVADNLFWLGRYAERLEDTVRMLRSILNRLSGEAGGDSSAELAGLVQILVEFEHIPPLCAGRVAQREVEQELLQLIYNPQRIGGVRELVLRIRQIASIVRDRFSADTWRILNQLQTDARSRPGRIPVANALSLLNTLVVDLAAFSGMEMENMTRGHGWRFLDFGRRLERALNLVRLVRACLASESHSSTLLEPLLEIADSSMTYRRRYFAQVEISSVLDLLLLDPGNPRALAFQLHALAEHSGNLPRDPSATATFGSGRVVLLEKLLHSRNPSSTPNPNLPPTPTRNPASVQPRSAVDWIETLDQIAAGLVELSEELTHVYFNLTVARVS